MSRTPRAIPLPPWTIVQPDDPRSREGAVEPSEFISGEWAHSVGAASNRAWINSAKVIALMAGEHPEARYVEGWAAKGGVSSVVWHAWVDVPLDRMERSWMRLDCTPMWRWMIKETCYAPVLEVRASDLAPLVEPLRRPRGRALCRLPIAGLVGDPTGSYREPTPCAATVARELGAEVITRMEEARDLVATHVSELTSMVHTDGTAELDRLAALRLLPPER